MSLHTNTQYRQTVKRHVHKRPPATTKQIFQKTTNTPHQTLTPRPRVPLLKHTHIHTQTHTHLNAGSKFCLFFSNALPLVSNNA